MILEVLVQRFVGLFRFHKLAELRIPTVLRCRAEFAFLRLSKQFSVQRQLHRNLVAARDNRGGNRPRSQKGCLLSLLAGDHEVESVKGSPRMSVLPYDFDTRVRDVMTAIDLNQNAG